MKKDKWSSSRKEKTGRHMIMIYPPTKTCCRADNDELCSLSLMPCNLFCRRGDLDVISEMLSNLKKEGLEEAGYQLHSLLGFFISVLLTTLSSPADSYC